MSLSDWMFDADYEWRQRLQSVNLAIETDFTEDEIREAQRKFGAASIELRKRGLSPQEIVKKYPGLALAILVGHASLAYDQGAYWDSFWQELGLGRDPDFEQAIRGSVVGLLDKFALARFPDVEKGDARKYVTMFTLHSGIPIHCLRDLLELAYRHIAQGRPANGVALTEWVLEPGKEHRSATLDKPVLDFFTHGAEFALDILDRIIEFMEAATADPSLLQATFDASTTGLPTVILGEIVRQLREAPLSLDRRRITAVGTSRPSITYSSADDEVVLVLPSPPDDTEKPWRVSFDGDVRDVHAIRQWGADERSATATVTVPEPVHEVIVTRGEEGLALPLVAPADPLMIFSSGGQLVPRHDGMRETAWAVFPDGHDLVDTTTLKPATLNDEGCPAGWHGWRSAFIELDNVHGLQLYKNGDLVGTPRRIYRAERPHLHPASPIPGLTTADGPTVYADRPAVTLPATTVEPAPKWAVRVRHPGEQEWLFDQSVAASKVEVHVDPFAESVAPQLGLFEILVTGPMGLDVRGAFFIAEGLTTQFHPTIRVPDNGRLSGCAASVESSAHAVSPAGLITIDDRELSTRITVGSGDTEQQLLVTPPHVEMRSGQVGTPAPWRMVPEICDPDEFAQNRFAAVRAPGIERVEFRYVSANGELLQADDRPRRRRGDIFESRLQQFADTVRTHPGGRLEATLHTDGGPLNVVVLRAQSPRLASGVHLAGERLEFADVAEVSDLAVYVWNTTTPWNPPEVIPVHNGTAHLPEHLIERGALRCQLFIDDPWVLTEPPPHATPDSFLIEQLGWSEEGMPAQNRLSRYLGSQSSAPIDIGFVPEVWDALAWLATDGKAKRFTGLAELLVGEPRTALECLGDSTIAPGNKMSLVVRSKLITRNFAVDETLNDLHAHPWFGCMVELADLTSLYRRRDEVSAERAETLAYLREWGGQAFIELLETGTTTGFRDSCIDSSIVRRSVEPLTQLETELRELQKVPLPQLHPDNLRAGLCEALLRRAEWMENGWSTNFAQQAAFLINPIKSLQFPCSYQVIETRMNAVLAVDESQHPWASMSLQSLILAVAARLMAYGRLKESYFNSGLLGEWAQLALLCPTMVANDLLIAEAVVLHDRRGNVIGEN
jgi:hypothetical protein